MLEEIVGSSGRKTKIEKYSPFRIRGLGKTLEGLPSPLPGPTSKIICKSKAKIAIYKQEEILRCEAVLAFRKSVNSFFLLLFLFPLSYLHSKVSLERLIDKYVMLCPIPDENTKNILLLETNI